MNTSDAHTITVGGDPITPNPTAALLWLDVETTGLDPNTCSILEIGAICTSLDTNTEYGRYETFIHIDSSQLLEIALPALKMHTATASSPTANKQAAANRKPPATSPTSSTGSPPTKASPSTPQAPTSSTSTYPPSTTCSNDTTTTASSSTNSTTGPST